MAYAPPDPKKVKALRERREAEDRKAREIASCYRQHTTGQQRYARWRDSDAERSLARAAAELGIDLAVRIERV